MNEFTEPGEATVDDFAARYLAHTQRVNSLANRCMIAGKLRQLGWMDGWMDGMTVKVRVRDADTR